MAFDAMILTKLSVYWVWSKSGEKCRK